MYQDININSIIAEATQVVLKNDRLLYKKFYTFLENFCHQHAVYIGGDIAVDFATHCSINTQKINNGWPVCISKDRISWVLYTKMPWDTSKLLADSIFESVKSEEIPVETTLVKTILAHKEYNIFLYGRHIVTIKRFPKFKGQFINVPPFLQRGIFTNVDLCCMPLELQLINVYGDLYNITKHKTWIDRVDQEELLFNLFRNGMAKTGGTDTKHRNGQPVLRHVYSFIEKTGGILINTNLMYKPIFLTSESSQNICSKLSQKIGAEVSIIRQSLFIDDFQLRKFFIFVHIDHERVLIGTFYNSLMHEVIPYYTQKLQISPGYNGEFRIACDYVCLKFAMIDYWGALVANNPKKCSAAYNRITALKKNKQRSIETIYGVKWEGTSIDSVLMKQKKQKESGKFFPDYIPAIKLLGNSGT